MARKKHTGSRPKTQKVYPYDDPFRRKEELVLRTYEYHHPFHYANVTVHRYYNCGEQHGMELNPVNSHYPDTEHRPADWIEIAEDEPIVRVVVVWINTVSTNSSSNRSGRFFAGTRAANSGGS